MLLVDALNKTIFFIDAAFIFDTSFPIYFQFDMCNSLGVL